jgi:hypothetical protein
MLYFVRNYSLRTRHSHIVLAEIVVAKKQKYIKLIFCVYLLTAYSFRTCSIKKKEEGGCGVLNDFAGLRATDWTKIHIPFNIFPGGLTSTENSSCREV